MGKASDEHLGQVAGEGTQHATLNAPYPKLREKMLPGRCTELAKNTYTART